MFRKTSSRVRKLYSYLFHCYRTEGKIKENVAIKPEENKKSLKLISPYETCKVVRYIKARGWGRAISYYKLIP